MKTLHRPLLSFRHDRWALPPYEDRPNFRRVRHAQITNALRLAMQIEARTHGRHGHTWTKGCAIGITVPTPKKGASL